MSRFRSLNFVLRTWSPQPKDQFAAQSRHFKTSFTLNTSTKFSKMATSDSKASVPATNSPSVDAASQSPAPQEKPLPKLSPTEFRQFNRMADHMDHFHSNFRQTWNVLYTACTTQKRPSNMSIRQFLSMGEQFCHHLTVHHTIEEQHIFPVLAKKMPAFRKELELLTQHKQIHNGLDKFEKYIEECGNGERELRMGEMKELMDGFGEVLWQHLDDEVKQLGAENMRKYWTAEEIRRMPM
jgi:hemerythrin-like domain-containing protein